MNKIIIVIVMTVFHSFVMAMDNSSDLIVQSFDLHLNDGSSLHDELLSYTGEGYENSGNLPELTLHYNNDKILSISFYWSFYGPYPSEGIIYHTFDLVSNKEIVLWNEIDNNKIKAFINYLYQKIQPILLIHRNEYSDSEWMDAFNISDELELDKLFFVKDISRITSYYIKNNVLHLVVDGYFEFPHAIRAMDLFTEINITIFDLEEYLKKDSSLKRIKD